MFRKEEIRSKDAQWWGKCWVGALEAEVCTARVPVGTEEKKEPISNTNYFVTQKKPHGFGYKFINNNM
jgi:hypothetical protein